MFMICNMHIACMMHTLIKMRYFIETMKLTVIYLENGRSPINWNICHNIILKLKIENIDKNKMSFGISDSNR